MTQADGSTTLSRRKLLVGAGTLAGALAGARLPGAWAAPAPQGRGYPFTLGVASGDPTPDAVVIWTRLVPDPLHGGGMPERDVEVRFEVAADERFGRIVREGTRLAQHAYRAYFEHLPLRRPPAPSGPDLRLYGRVPWGDLAEFQVLDTRQYRSDQPCGDGFPANCAERFEPDRTILGAEQERWLFDGLARSRAHRNVLAQQIFLAKIDLVAGPRQGVYVDGWDGYVASRNRLLGSLHEAQVSNPVVLTGDWHANWLCDLKARYGDPDSPVVGTEFVGTSISSTDVEGARPQYGLVALDENPHIRYFDNERGYVRCSVDRSSWRTDYRVVPYVDRPGAPVETAASFVVNDGDPKAHRA